MELVEATADDVDALVDRWFSLAKGMEEYSKFNELSYASPADVSGEGFERHLARDDVADYLMRVGRGTVGFLTLREGTHPSREYARYLRIVNLYVDEEHRNAGYGSEAVERAREMARERGCDHLKVSCEWHNDGARRFYREGGFEEKQVAFVQELE